MLLQGVQREQVQTAAKKVSIRNKEKNPSQQESSNTSTQDYRCQGFSMLGMCPELIYTRSYHMQTKFPSCLCALDKHSEQMVSEALFQLTIFSSHSSFDFALSAASLTL